MPITSFIIKSKFVAWFFGVIIALFNAVWIGSRHFNDIHITHIVNAVKYNACLILLEREKNHCRYLILAIIINGKRAPIQ